MSQHAEVQEELAEPFSAPESPAQDHDQGVQLAWPRQGNGNLSFNHCL
jgi:hypothetical protein